MENIQFKDSAKAVSAYLKEHGFDVPHTRMLEALARGFGERNWSTLAAQLETLRSSEAGFTAVRSKLQQVLDSVTDNDCFVLIKPAEDAPGKWKSCIIKAKKAIPLLWRTLTSRQEPSTAAELIESATINETACFDFLAAHTLFQGPYRSKAEATRLEAVVYAKLHLELEALHGYRAEVVEALVSEGYAVCAEEQIENVSLLHAVEIAQKASNTYGFKASAREINDAALRML